MIRPYAPDDLEDLLCVWAAASAVAHRFLGEAFLEGGRHNIPNLYLPNADTWVWEDGGRVRGFIALIGNEVGAIFVDPAFHGTGIGRALMDRARGQRADLEVEVFKENAGARQFYATYGFELMHELTHEPTGFGLLRLKLQIRQ